MGFSFSTRGFLLHARNFCIMAVTVHRKSKIGIVTPALHALYKELYIFILVMHSRSYYIAIAKLVHMRDCACVYMPVQSDYVGSTTACKKRRRSASLIATTRVCILEPVL